MESNAKKTQNIKKHLDTNINHITDGSKYLHILSPFKESEKYVFCGVEGVLLESLLFL